MDGSRMELGERTRRRFAQLLGGLSLSLLPWGRADESDARRKRRRHRNRHRNRNRDRDRDKDRDKDRERRRKRKRHRKRNRCVKLAKSCSQTGTACCGSLVCEDFGRPTNLRCCLPSGYGCSTNRDDECCPGLGCVNGFCAFP